MRALPENTRRRRVVAALALIAAAGAAGATLAGCGGSHAHAAAPAASSAAAPSSALRPVTSGRVSLSLVLPNGYSLALAGPFASGHAGAAGPPRFALEETLRDGRETVRSGATFTGTLLYARVGGRYYLAPARAVRALRAGYAEERRKLGAGPSAPFLPIDPAALLEHALRVGTQGTGAGAVEDLRTSVPASRMLAPLRTLLAQAQALAAARSPAGAPPLASAAAAPVQADVYVGARDRLLRRIVVTAARSAAQPRERAALQLTFAIAGANTTQRIAAPAHALPWQALEGRAGA